MLKFVDKKGKLKMIWLDDDSQPCKITNVAKEILRDLGIVIEDDDSNIKPTPSGISQDDVKHLKGDN